MGFYLNRFPKADKETRLLYSNEDTRLMGALFELFAQTYPAYDLAKFVESFMRSRLREAMDSCDSRLLNLHSKRLLELYIKEDLQGTDIFHVTGKPTQYRENELRWVGEAYVRLSIHMGWSSKETIEKVPFEIMHSAFQVGHEMGWSSFLSRFDA